MKENLNDNDNKLLAYCFNRRRHLSDIAANIEIDVKNVSTRIDKLKRMGLIKVEIMGNKKFIRTIDVDKTKDFFIELLKQLNERGGDMKQEDFLSLVPFPFVDDGKVNQDKFSAPLKMMYVHPKLVEHHIKITEEGKKFLKDNSKCNNT